MKLRHLAAACLLLTLGPAFAAAPAAGLDLQGQDRTVRPQDDLFRAANGQWLKDTPIPADKHSYGGFIMLRDRAEQRVRAIAEELAARAPDAPGTGDEKKIADYYRSHVDEAALDAAGLAPLAPWLQRIAALKDKAALAQLFGALQGIAPVPLVLRVAPDAADPQVYRLHSGQDGLGLPDRDYYLKDDPRYLKAREAYRHYLATVLRLLGDERAAEQADAVYALEKRLAEAQRSRVDNRDPLKRHNPTTLAALREAAPGFAWELLLRGAGVRTERLIVGQPEYHRALAAIAGDTPLPVWQAYLRVRLVDRAGELLPKALREAHFAYHDKTVRGQAQPAPRWQLATRSLNEALGDAVGRLYVARHFTPAHKAKMQEMVGHLLAAYRDSIDGLTWMSPETKRRAQDKLAKYSTKIGYPEVWRDYAGLDIRPGDAFGNLARAGRFEFERRAARVDGPVDRREWFTPPQTVNAFYSGTGNEIVFPAGILEPPFFDIQADDAVNYGAIGAIIGHEISHGFDDGGSRYDGDGRLANWWTEADRKAFEALADQLVAQYGAYEALPGHKVNGRLTLGENIADLSGLQIAHKAYRRSLKGRPAPEIGGMSGDQRFFYGWAQAWRNKYREERQLQLLTIDTHSPSHFRANGAAVNHDAFHDSFGTQPGDGMFKPAEQRIRIW